MYSMTHPERGETTVYTELSMMRHLEAGWEMKKPEEKLIEAVEEQPKRRGRKPRNDDSQ